jgi:hypothetical protein
MAGAAGATHCAWAAASTAAGTAPPKVARKAADPARQTISTPRAHALLLAANTPPTAAIDELVARKWREAHVAPAKLADDAAFVRRIYLDLVGRIPAPGEVDAFVADGSSGKRAALVDRLLASPEYARHMRDVFDVVFMGRGNTGAGPGRRRGSAGAGQDVRREWLSYLERGFAENRPWDRTVRDLVLARPEAEADRGSIWFLYGRRDRYQEIAETVASSILGIQVQCAQCHNHFVVPEILQKDYWGLVAFFNRGKNVDTAAGPAVSEAAIGGFSSFATLAGQSFPAELTFFGTNVPEVRPAVDVKEEDSPALYQPPPPGSASSQPRVPLFSRRAQFADKVLRGNPRVARAAVNRFWALLMGRGLVHPVDRIDSQHPPSHPELLDWLARDFERSGYDVNRLVRAIVLSRPYQLEARPGAGVRREASGVSGRSSSQARHDLIASKPHPPELTPDASRLTPAPDLFAAGLEKPLTAEQLYRSLLVATTGKTDTENPELERTLVAIFSDMFPEEHVSTLQQALFLTNNPVFQQLARVAPGTTAERLAAIMDPAARVRQAFRVAYARDPDAEELAGAARFLKVRADRTPQATAQLWWALLAGAEFRFNH